MRRQVEGGTMGEVPGKETQAGSGEEGRALHSDCTHSRHTRHGISDARRCPLSTRATMQRQRSRQHRQCSSAASNAMRVCPLFHHSGQTRILFNLHNFHSHDNRNRTSII